MESGATGPRQLRVLMLASYFPKPANPTMGIWALEQAQAIKKSGVAIEVVSLTPWIPNIPGAGPSIRAYANGNREHMWGDLRVTYLRWLYYAIGPAASLTYQDPQLFLNLGWLSVAKRLGKKVEDFKPDVIYSHHSIPNGYVALKLKSKYGLPFVVTDHDFDEIAACAYVPKRYEVINRIATNADRMIAVCKRMEHLTGSIFPTAKTITVHNGACVNNVIEARPAELNDKIVILCVGIFYERKGIPLLIRAFSRIAEIHSIAILKIIGDGPDHDKVKDAVEQSGFSNRIILMGKQPHSVVQREMAWCDCFALIGWNEPFGVVYAEAMAAGKPIIYCADCGIADVAISGQHGWQVMPQDLAGAATALDEAVRNHTLRNKMGHAARILFEQKLSWAANADKMRSIFAEAVSK